MLARNRITRLLPGLCLALALGASAQDFIEDRQSLSGLGATTPDLAAGLMVEAAPAFETVDEELYLVGPGDIFYVAMGTRGYKVMISPDGAAIIDGFPQVYINGKTLSQARRLLAQNYQRYYKGGNVHVSLAQAKRFQISITGAVNAPGMLVVIPGSRLSTVVRAANNLSRMASQRAVIRDASGKQTLVDLGAYYRDGDLENNPYVSQGDHIFLESIDYSKPIVYVQSERGTRAVQVSPGENAANIVARSVDFENAPEWDHVNVFKDGKLIQRVERTAASGYVPPEGATVEVRATQMLVFVGGAVLTPGSFPYNPTFTILDYISRAGITYNTASAKKATVIDARGDARKVNANKESPKPGDHILVPRSGEAKTRDWVGLTAAVSGLILSVVSLSILINQQ